MRRRSVRKAAYADHARLQDRVGRGEALLARYGGEEFVVLAPACAQCRTLAQAGVQCYGLNF
jgi:GGDEF domain-containing protein